jgi:hypothetical protein
MCTIRPSWLDAAYSQTSTFTSKLKYGSGKFKMFYFLVVK